MDVVQRVHEQAVGDDFIRWYNLQNHSSFSFNRRGDQAPDLIYHDGRAELFVEVADAYYDDLDAKFKWETARGSPNPPIRWEGVDFDNKLIDHINARLEDKCQKSYGRSCFLVLNLSPYVTAAEEIEAMLPNILVPERNPFEAIYLTGYFPEGIMIGQSTYHCWQIV